MTAIGPSKQLRFRLLSTSLENVDTTGGRIVSNRIQSTIHIAILSAFALAASIGSAASQSQPSGAPAPKFDKASGAVVGGLSGLVTATASGLNGYRSAQRVMAFRTALTRALKESLKPGFDATKPITIAPANAVVLCSMRGDYAVLAAKAAYINGVTSTLNQFATPPTITTIGQAFTSIFQNYEIDATTGKIAVDGKAVVTACRSDLDSWPLSFYGAPIAGLPTSGVGELLAAGAALSSLSSLLSDLNAIVTPVATQAAQFIDAQQRAAKIKAFLTKYQADLLTAAKALAADGNLLLATNRITAVGQFEEKLALVRTFKIDLSKVDACKTAAAAPALADEKGVPTDAFVACYALVWAQLNEVVQAAITAASQYDALADTSTDQLGNSVQAIQKHIAVLSNPQAPTVSELIDAATQLITIGQSVATALSPDNVKKIEKDTENVMNAFK